MGAPAIINEKLAGGGESACVLKALQRVVLSGVCGEEVEEGRRGNERLRVSKMDLGGGKQAWVANTEDLGRIDVSDPLAISLVNGGVGWVLVSHYLWCVDVGVCAHVRAYMCVCVCVCVCVHVHVCVCMHVHAHTCVYSRG